MPTPEPSGLRGREIRIAQISAEHCWTDPGALERNAAKTLQWYERAADEADLIVFPELILTGYIPATGYNQKVKRLLAELAQRVAGEELPRIAAATRGRRAAMVVGFMEPSTMRNEFYNSAALLQDGNVLGVYRKMHLPTEENHYFIPGDTPAVVDCRAGRVGLIICYDLVFPEAARLAALEGAETLCVPSNWLAREELEHLTATLSVARALEEQMHVVFANGVGTVEVRGRAWRLYGGSTIVNAVGQVLVRGGAEEEMVAGVLSEETLAAAANIFPVLRDRRPDAYGNLVASRNNFARVRSGRTP